MPEGCIPRACRFEFDGKPYGGAIPEAWFWFQPHIVTFILAHSNPRSWGRFDE